MPSRNGSGPYFVFPTQRGSIVNLTPAQVLSILEDEDEKWMSISAFDATELQAPLLKSSSDFPSFCGLHGFKAVLSFRSSFQGCHTGSSSNDAFSADHEKGRVTLNFEKWEKVFEAMKPAVAVCPFEPVALSESSEKKRKAAQTRNANWKNRVSSMQSLDGIRILYSDGLDSSDFFSAMPGPENLSELAAGLQQLCRKRQHNQNSFSMIYANSLPQMMEALRCGVTLIESTLPWNLAEKGIALNIAMLQDIADGNVRTQSPLLLELSDHQFQLDATPIAAHCKCFTCEHHTKAYIHHLISVQEMNSPILLAIHNVWMITSLFRSVRKSGDKEKIQLLDAIEAQCTF